MPAAGWQRQQSWQRQRQEQQRLLVPLPPLPLHEVWRHAAYRAVALLDAVVAHDVEDAHAAGRAGGGGGGGGGGGTLLGTRVAQRRQHTAVLVAPASRALRLASLYRYGR